MVNQKSIGHSSTVNMVLRIENQLLQVAQMGPDFLILKDFFSSPARSGIVTLTVDGESEEIPVHFRASITPSSKRIAITELETADFATTA